MSDCTLLLNRIPVLALALLAVAKCSLGDDSSLLARLKTEAPREWKEFERLSKSFDVELTQRHLHPTATMVTKFAIKTSGENTLFTQSYLEVPESQRARLQGVERVKCQNSENSFKLEKREAGLPWLVEYLGDTGGLDEQLEDIDTMLLFPLYVYVHNIADWFASSDFIIKNVEWVERPAGKLVAVTFHRAKSDKETYWIHDGVLYLNPERMWAIQEFTYDATGKKGEEHVAQQTEFRTDRGRLPLVKASALVAQTPRGEVKSLLDFSRFEYRSIPEEEFTLTAFGLPEIARPNPLHHLAVVRFGGHRRNLRAGGNLAPQARVS